MDEPPSRSDSDESDLDGGGLLVYWPLALVHRDVLALTVEFEEIQRKKAAEQKKRAREAREAQQALEASDKTNPYSRPYSGTKRR
jgi:hypothetical protein